MQDVVRITLIYKLLHYHLLKHMAMTESTMQLQRQQAGATMTES